MLDVWAESARAGNHDRPSAGCFPSSRGSVSSWSAWSSVMEAPTCWRTATRASASTPCDRRRRHRAARTGRSARSSRRPAGPSSRRFPADAGPCALASSSSAALSTVRSAGGSPPAGTPCCPRRPRRAAGTARICRCGRESAGRCPDRGPGRATGSRFPTPSSDQCFEPGVASVASIELAHEVQPLALAVTIASSTSSISAVKPTST